MKNRNRVQTGLKIITLIYLLTCLTVACNTQGMPNTINSAMTPTQTINTPSLQPTEIVPLSWFTGKSTNVNRDIVH